MPGISVKSDLCTWNTEQERPLYLEDAAGGQNECRQCEEEEDLENEM
jgi:hypothetical protein